MKALHTLSQRIDALNQWVDQVVAWVTLGLVLVVLTDMVMRSWFKTSVVLTQELEWHLFAFFPGERLRKGLLR